MKHSFINKKQIIGSLTGLFLAEVCLLGAPIVVDAYEDPNHDGLVNTYYEHFVFDPNEATTHSDYTRVRLDTKLEPYATTSKDSSWTSVIKINDQYDLDDLTTKAEVNNDGLGDYDINGRHIVRYGKNMDYCSWEYGTNPTYGTNKNGVDQYHFQTDADGFEYYAAGWYWHYNDLNDWISYLAYEGDLASETSNDSPNYPSRRWYVEHFNLPTNGDLNVFTNAEYPVTRDSEGVTFQIYYVPKKVNMSISGDNLSHIYTNYQSWVFNEVTYHYNTANGYENSNPLIDSSGINRSNKLNAIKWDWTNNGNGREWNGNGTGSITASDICYTQFTNVYVSPATGYLITGYWVNGTYKDIQDTAGETVIGFQMTVYDNPNTDTVETNTLVIQTAPITYTVQYNGNGNTGGSTGASIHTYNVVQNLTANGFTKTGYTFAGWATSSTGGVVYSNQQSVKNLASTKGAVVTLYAKWTPISYTVQYNGNGNTGGSTASSSHTYDSAKALTANGFTRQYTVSFNSNGGTACGNQTATYSFYGWHTSAQGVDSYSRQYTNQESVSNLTTTSGGTVNLYATWNSASITLPAPTRTGYIFAGWYTNSALTAKAGNASASYKPTANITLYAKWTPITYTIQYNGNGNTGGSTANSTHTYDSSKALTANGFTKDGYAFAGWATSSTGGVVYKNQQSVLNLTATNGGVITLYAKWTANTYTVAYKANSATSMSDYTYKATYDVSFGLPTPTRTGYTFKGWMVSEGSTRYTNNGTKTNPMTNGVSTYLTGSSNWNFTTANGGTVTLIAIWEHAHPTASITTSKLVTSSAYIYSVNAPTYYTSNSLGYWVNTNKLTTLSWQVQGNSGSSDTYYAIKSYGLYKNGNVYKKVAINCKTSL